MQFRQIIFLLFFLIFIIFLCLLSSQNTSNLFLYSSYYCWPTPSYHTITSPFGYRHRPLEGASTFHQGIDIAAKEGSGVSVMADGIVTYAEFHASAGNMIIVKHDNGLQSYYEHLAEEMYVSPGDKVQKGEVIGRVGPLILSNGKRNGVSTGVHLHFGVRLHGNYVNPMTFYETPKTSKVE